MDNIRKFDNGIKIESTPTVDLTLDQLGEFQVDSNVNKALFHNGTSASPLVTEAHTATLTNKTLTSPIINTPDINGATLSLNDTDSVFNLEVQSTSTLTTDKTLTIDVNDGNRTLTIAGDATVNGSNSGDVTVTDTATIDITLAGQNISAIVVAGSIGDTQLGSNLDVSQFADGTVSNTEFQFINSLTSNAQTQLDAKVTGPASATDEAIARYDGTTGKLVQNSLVTITDAGVMSGVTQLNVDNLRLDGNTIASTDTDGDIVLSPNGAGDVDLNIGTGTVNLGNSATVDNAGIGSGFTQFNVDNLRLDGNTLSSTNSNGNISLDPNGTGQISAEDPIRISEQASSPATPASGYSVLYPKTDGYLYYKNDAGAETRIQAGSGGINYILNSDAEGGTTGWATYADAAGTVPVDGTGGSPNITLTASTSAPLRGLQSFLITKDAANRQGQGVSYDFTIDPADVSKSLKISYDYSASAAYTGSTGTEYMVTYVYDITNAVQIPSSNIYMPRGSGTQEVTFNATTSTSYRLEFHIAGTGTSAWTYKYDNVQLGPQEVILSAAMSNWESYTPTFSAGWGTTTNVSFRYRRVGDTIDIMGSFEMGTVSAAEASFTLPSGLTVDSSKQSLFGNRSTVGEAQYSSAGGDLVYDRTLACIVDSTNFAKIYFSYTNSANAAATVTNMLANVNDVLTSNAQMNLRLHVPITQWANSVDVTNSRIEYGSNSGMGDAADTTSFVNSIFGNSLPTVGYTAPRKKRVRFLNPIQQSDTIQVQFYDFNGGSWQDWNSTNLISQPSYRAGGAQYGFGGLTQVNSTDVDVQFGEYRREGAVAWGNAGDSWSGTDANYKWRVVKYSNAVPVSSSSTKATAEYSFFTATGLSSTNTAIPYYTTASLASDTGSLLTVSNSATLGLSVTALKRCTVWMAFPMGYAGTADYKGITKNSTQLSTTIDSVTNSFVRFKTFSASSVVTEVMAKVPMEIGDVLRPHLATGVSLNGYMIYISAEEL